MPVFGNTETMKTKKWPDSKAELNFPHMRETGGSRRRSSIVEQKHKDLLCKFKSLLIYP